MKSPNLENWSSGELFKLPYFWFSAGKSVSKWIQAVLLFWNRIFHPMRCIQITSNCFHIRLFYWSIFHLYIFLNIYFLIFSMGGGELFNAIQEKQSFNERGKSWTIFTRGQIKSEWIYEIIDPPKMANEKFEGFLP